jgi:hypothetical protein
MSTVKDECPTKTCDPSVQSDLDSAKKLGTISTIAFVVAGVGVGVGVVGLLNPSKAEPAPKAAAVVPVIGLGTIGLKGSF